MKAAVAAGVELELLVPATGPGVRAPAGNGGSRRVPVGGWWYAGITDREQVFMQPCLWL